MLKILLAGSSGRMGKEISELVGLGNSDASLVGSLTSKGVELSGTPNIIIDFSLPTATQSVLAQAELNNLPLVSGVTGYSAQQLEALKVYSKKAPVFWAPNMSLGVAFLNSIIARMGVLGDEFDFQIQETHHNKKIDSPSGTAVFLQATLLEAVGKAPEPLAIRGGGVIGEHSVFALSNEEVIEVKHSAIRRSVFAKGALSAAKWLLNKNPGFYQMSDIVEGSR